MDNLEAIIKSVRNHLWLNIALENIIFGLSIYIGINYTSLATYQVFVVAGAIAVFFIIIIGISTSKFINQPLSALRQAILHLSPAGTEPVNAPDINNLSLGLDLVTNLVGQLYEIAKVGHQSALSDGSKQSTKLDQDFIANSLPLPLFVLDDSENIQFVNKSASSYLGLQPSDLLGKNVYTILDMSFQSEETFDNWLKNAKKQAVVSSNTWERVRLNGNDQRKTLLFDLASYYNRGNTEGKSTLIILFDHTKQYSRDDQAISFVSLSVHELRSSMTLLRGYIEVFEQELRGKVSPEMEGFLNKMQVSAAEITAFINNILNVARIDDDQMELKLQPEDWAQVLAKIIDEIRIRASVRDITLELDVAPGLPKVGVDRLSIQEVMNNLIDNAIKYSGKSKVIKISAKLNNEKLVETTVQDFGVGIPTRQMPNLFTKYYRDYKNRSHVVGTGLGLYLSKAIVSAHGGNIWVRSEEDKGSTFGFTIIPYDQISEERKSQNDDVVRVAHGWIKNHSYYRH